MKDLKLKIVRLCLDHGKFEGKKGGESGTNFAAWFGSYCILPIYVECALCFWRFLNSICLCLLKKKWNESKDEER